MPGLTRTLVRANALSLHDHVTVSIVNFIAQIFVRSSLVINNLNLKLAFNSSPWCYPGCVVYRASVEYEPAFLVLPVS